MHTKVVFQSAKALTRIGCAVLRFNFRGVGRSAGAWDEGRGEMDDYQAAVDFMARRIQASSCGPRASRSAHIAMTGGADDDRICAMIGIAPPVDRYDFASVKRSTKPKFVIHGEMDELIPLKLVREFYAQLEGPEGAGRDRSRQSPLRRTGGRGGRRARRPADGFLMQDAVIVSATRTAVGKAPSGALRTVRPDEMAATVIGEALRRAPGVDPDEIDDVILGCAMPEAEQGLNVARIASLRAGVPVSASAVTINRFCSSGLQAIAYAAERIMCGFANAIVAGGTESMSLVPMGGNKVSPNPALVDSYPDVYLSTGLVAENHVRDYGISREEQDAFALRSHQRAVAAIDAGRFTDEIVPLTYRVASSANGTGAPSVRERHVRAGRRAAARHVAAGAGASCGRPFMCRAA